MILQKIKCFNGKKQSNFACKIAKKIAKIILFDIKENNLISFYIIFEKKLAFFIMIMYNIDVDLR
jgi:hypothetical protein